MEKIREEWFVGKDGNWNKITTFQDGKKKMVRYLGQGIKKKGLRIPSVIVFATLGIFVAFLAIMF